MIKKVKTTRLVAGVYIHDFNCELNGENVFIEPGLVRDEAIIKILHSWGINEVYIDTDKGLSVEDSGQSNDYLTSHSQLTDRIDLNGWQSSKKQYVPLQQELKEAKKILHNAIGVVEDTIRQVKEGKSPDVKDAYAVVRQMKKSIVRNRDALILLARIRKKDEYTLYHSISVSSLVLGLCGYSGLPEKESLDIAVGALFHDIGKTIIPHTILNKPGKLNEFEYNEIKKHTDFSVKLLHNAKGLPMECFDIALHHHERFDGTGYPHGLHGNQIHHGTQMVAVCDVFDAITSARCYKEKMDPVSGLQIMYQMAGSHFATETLYNFIRFIGVYPVGSYVVTSDEKIAVVTGSTDNMLQPIVKVLYDKVKQQKISPYTINLSETGETIKSYAEKSPGTIG